MFDFGRGDAVPLVKKVGGRRSPAFPLENITALNHQNYLRAILNPSRSDEIDHGNGFVCG
jgi:hypothetical protein